MIASEDQKTSTASTLYVIWCMYVCVRERESFRFKGKKKKRRKQIQIDPTFCDSISLSVVTPLSYTAGNISSTLSLSLSLLG